MPHRRDFRHAVAVPGSIPSAVAQPLTAHSLARFARGARAVRTANPCRMDRRAASAAPRAACATAPATCREILTGGKDLPLVSRPSMRPHLRRLVLWEYWTRTKHCNLVPILCGDRRVVGGSAVPCASNQARHSRLAKRERRPVGSVSAVRRHFLPRASRKVLTQAQRRVASRLCPSERSRNRQPTSDDRPWKCLVAEGTDASLDRDARSLRGNCVGCITGGANLTRQRPWYRRLLLQCGTDQAVWDNEEDERGRQEHSTAKHEDRRVLSKRCGE